MPKNIVAMGGDANGLMTMIYTQKQKNVEIVQFAPTMAGTYTIRVIRADDSSETVYYALAWR